MPGVGELPFGDVQIGDVAVERRAYVAVVVVELRVLDRFLSGADSLIDVAYHAQRVLRLLKFRIRGGDARFRRFELVAGFDHLVVGNKIAFAQGNDAVQVLFGVCRGDLALGQLRLGGADGVVKGFDLDFGEVQPGSGRVERELVRTRIYDVQEVAGSYPLIILDRQLNDLAAHVGRDRRGVRLNVGVVGSRIGAIDPVDVPSQD